MILRERLVLGGGDLRFGLADAAQSRGTSRAGGDSGRPEQSLARPRPAQVSDRPCQVTWAPTAQRDTRRLPEKVATAVAEFAYGPLAENPGRVGRPLNLDLA